MKVVAAAAALLLAGYLGVQAIYPSLSFRYRLTLQVETPEGVKTGSSVLLVTETSQPKVGSGSGGATLVTGEAVAVDLGARGVLFALLKGDDYASQPGSVVYVTFPPPKGSYAAAPENLRRYAQSSEKAELPTSRLPLLVRFRNINDPKTAERVDPNNLAASFGSGVRVLRATLELTRDPLIRRVELTLPWLTALKGGYLHGGDTSRDAPLGLHGGDFSRGS